MRSPIPTLQRLLLIPTLALAGSPVADAAVEVAIAPGDDIQAAVDAHPPGTTFVIRSGVHRLQSVAPLAGDIFIGEPGAVLSGARLLTSFGRSGALWTVTGQTQEGGVHGEMEPGYEGGAYAEDLYIDDAPLRHVTSLAAVAAGTWFFDYPNDTIYFADDPTGHRVETSVTTHAFASAAAGVTIRNLTIEKYATLAQFGAIQAHLGTNGLPDYAPGAGWLVTDNEVRLNHGVGIIASPGMRALRNRVHHNGVFAFGGSGEDILIQDNELASNNYTHTNAGWGAGGAKWTVTDRLIVRGNFCHDNFGAGLWTDILNDHVLYEGNLCAHNDFEGIFHEISYAAAIRGNTCVRNGWKSDNWMYRAQILVGHSPDVEVSGNIAIVDADHGNGIDLLQQERPDSPSPLGAHISMGCSIHDNDVTYLAAQGYSGAGGDYSLGTLYGSNSFDHNHYHVADIGGARWQWNGAVTWSALRAAGQETSGTVDANVPALDATPPSVAIAEPANGAALIGVVSVRAGASDPSGVAGVRILIDGTPFGGDLTTAPYAFSIDASMLPAGAHRIVAWARDRWGNVAQSAACDVTVSNAASDAVPVSDLAFSEVANGWGPAERDQSNGETAVGDGHVLSLQGVRFAKGFGVHVGSEIRVPLGGAYQTFLADVGIDDEVGTAGSAIGEVWCDGVLRATTTTLRGEARPQSLSVDVRGVSELRLIGRDAGDGASSAHLDWAGARVIAAVSGTGSTGGATTGAGAAGGSSGGGATGADAGGSGSGGCGLGGGAALAALAIASCARRRGR